MAKARESMLPDALLADVVETFKALASPTRVRIIQALAQGELCVCDMSKVLDLSISATSHQLRTLRTLRLVSHRTEGKMVYYSLRDAFVNDLLQDATRHVSGEEASS